MGPLPLILVGFILTYVILKWLIPRLKAKGIKGKDLNKPEQPEVAEMGGLAVMLAFSLTAFIFYPFFSIDENSFLAIMLTTLFLSLIGVIDDLTELPKTVKVIIPILGSLPLVVLKAAGSTVIHLPIVGQVDLGDLYIYVIIPLSLTISANLTNMLAGFNGLEYGLAVPTYLGLLLLSLIHGNSVIVFFSSIFLGCALAFLIFNWYPAKIFPGDVGTLIIGGLLASLLLVGNFESYGLVLALYGLEFILKLANGLPSKGWQPKIVGGKLRFTRLLSVPQLILKLLGDLREDILVTLIIAAQSLVVVCVIFLNLFFQ